MAHAKPEYLGYDDSYDIEANTVTLKLANGPAVYKIESVLYTERVIIGRGTVLHEVSSKEEQYTMKTSWVLDELPREYLWLETAQGVCGVPKLMARDMSEPRALTHHIFTRAVAQTSPGYELFQKRDRVRVRIVMEAADPIETFRSHSELLYAFKDLVSSEWARSTLTCSMPNPV